MVKEGRVAEGPPEGEGTFEGDGRAPIETDAGKKLRLHSTVQRGSFKNQKEENMKERRAKNRLIRVSFFSHAQCSLERFPGPWRKIDLSSGKGRAATQHWGERDSGEKRGTGFVVIRERANFLRSRMVQRGYLETLSREKAREYCLEARA